MNLLQTYEAEQAMRHTHSAIARELKERQRLMQALARCSHVRSRHQPRGWLAVVAFVARFMHISRYGAVGRLEHEA